MTEKQRLQVNNEALQEIKETLAKKVIMIQTGTNTVEIELPEIFMHRSANHVRRKFMSFSSIYAAFGNSLRVTAPTSLPFCMTGEPLTNVFK